MRTLDDPRIVAVENIGSGIFEPVVHLKETTNRSIKLSVSDTESVTFEALMLKFLPTGFIKRTVETSNQYAKARYNPQEPPHVITEHSMLRFFAAILYMGVVALPDKSDYRCKDSLLPSHSELHRIKRDLFLFIWCNIHLLGTSERDENKDTDEQVFNQQVLPCVSIRFCLW